MTVGSLVSSAHDRITFSAQWQERLGRDHIEYFRMSEFAQWTGEFANREYWKEARRRALLADLFEILRRHAYRKVGCIVTTGAMAAMSPEFKKRWRLNAYVAAARLCCAGIRIWARGENHTAPMEYVFEEGDGQELLRQRLKLDDFPEPIFRPKKDQMRKGLHVRGYLPLQAADILAYELFKLQSDPRHRREYIRRELDGIIGATRRIRIAHAEGLQRELEEYEAAMESSERLSDWLEGEE